LDEGGNMNYLDKYNQLMAESKNNEPVEMRGLTYSQRKGIAPNGYHNHHIVPRADGGSDVAENIVTLPIKTHIYAHWLYAKHYGGKHWGSIRIIFNHFDFQNLSEDEVKFYSEIAEEGFSKHKELMSGKGNPFYNKKHTLHTKRKKGDKALYSFKNINGELFYGTRVDFCHKYNLPAQQISRLCLGVNKTAQGWYLEQYNPKGLTKTQMVKETWALNGKVVHLYHESGEEWVGPQSQAPVKLNKKYIKNNGWFFSKEDRDNYKQMLVQRALDNSAKRGDISGKNNPMYGVDRRKQWEIICVHKDGEIFEGKSTELADILSLTADQHMAMVKTFRGMRKTNGSVVKSYKGWVCEKISAP